MEYFDIILPHNEHACDIQEGVPYHMLLWVISGSLVLNVVCCLKMQWNFHLGFLWGAADLKMELRKI
jgi:hypothetical protein